MKREFSQIMATSSKSLPLNYHGIRFWATKADRDPDQVSKAARWETVPRQSRGRQSRTFLRQRLSVLRAMWPIAILRIGEANQDDFCGYDSTAKIRVVKKEEGERMKERESCVQLVALWLRYAHMRRTADGRQVAPADRQPIDFSCSSSAAVVLARCPPDTSVQCFVLQCSW
ncbi:hypothetical protein EVAR_65243_1 [Eumeta japonica]|uniref:Uncharacterized protein n=1 Tax=Eumeta variegata TaxID=151549 RepID=A0A4C1ZDQ3_EUMVA|nr:hypothetical protein EVAR_65243_1 [Eumeta japonica]